MKRFQITYQVQGSVPFPIDMLRYDASWPAFESETLPIMDTLDHRNDGTVTVALRSNRERGWQPTEGRWRSFGWSVVEGSVEQGPALD